MTSDRDNSKKTKIKVTKNGPYLISGRTNIGQQNIATDEENSAIKYETTREYPTRESCTLCRCGQSNNKPFCDGTHTKINFDGTETAGDENYLAKPNIVEGDVLKLFDVEKLCASARVCHRDGGIWELVKQSSAPRAERTACEEASDCPSGRLTVQDKRTGRVLEPALEPSIMLLEDPAMKVSGPIWVRGGIPIESAKGKTYVVRNRVTLCRCGNSANKPFCDSSHYPE